MRKTISTKFFIIFFYRFVYKSFYIYIKMSKNLSAKYYQEKKEKIQKKLVKDMKVFVKKKRKKPRTQS